MKNKKQSWRNTKEYHKWKEKVIERDKKCLICGNTKHLNSHHINSASYFPNERFNIENGVTLCHNHHTMFHNSYKNSYRQKCTKKDFANFLEMMIKISEETGFYNKEKMVEFRKKVLKE